jgi:uncharacterized Zn finger protein (UPF0148 family)
MRGRHDGEGSIRGFAAGYPCGMAEMNPQGTMVCPNCGAVVDYDLPNPEEHSEAGRPGLLQWTGSTECPSCGKELKIDLEVQDHPPTEGNGGARASD